MRIEIPEGKKLDKTIERAQLAARQGHEVTITRMVRIRGVVQPKPILFIHPPKGDIEEVLVPALRAPLGLFVVEQVLAEGHTEGAAARLLQAHNRIMTEGQAA